MADVLMLDDGCEGLEEWAEPLRREGFRVLCTSDAEQAAAEMRQHLPRLVVVGVSMIGRGWMPLVQELLRYNGDCPPIVIYCGRHHSEADGARPFGRCHFVARGVDWAQTRSRLLACLATRRPRPRAPASEDLTSPTFHGFDESRSTRNVGVLNR